MKTVAAACAALLLTAVPAVAQDIAGPLAAAVDQMGQGLGESMHGGPGIFVTAQGKAQMPEAAASPMILTIQGEGKTAAEAVAHRNAQLERVRSVANNFDVAIEVGATTYSISEAEDWAMTTASEATAWAGEEIDADPVEEDAAPAAPAAVQEDALPERTVTASVQVELQRPNETRLPSFIDALVDAGVTDLDDSLNGLNLGQLQPFLALLGLDAANDPGEAVWNAATADGVERARAQAESIAAASGRPLGPVRYVSVLMRSHDGDNALVSVAVRFGFAD